MKSLFVWYQDFDLVMYILNFGLFPGLHLPASYVVYWQLLF
jgi:hypothetical protein